jgi:hypothetical protein
MKHIIRDEELMDFLDGNLDREATADLKRRMRENGELDLLYHLRLAQKAFLDKHEEEDTLSEQLSVHGQNSSAVMADSARQRQAVVVSIGAVRRTGSKVLVLDPKRLAAAKQQGYLCDIECEEYILLSLGYEVNKKSLLDEAFQNKWMREKGMPIYHIGRLLEKYHLSVARRYDSNMDELSRLLSTGNHLIAVVNAAKLAEQGGVSPSALGDGVPSGEANPNHAVVVLKANRQEGVVELFDPQTGNSTDSCTLENFARAWADSQNFLVVANRHDAFAYDPQPISVADVSLNSELLELGEAIAENAHEIWASKRRSEGWQYGEERNDERLETPNMVPYSDLPETERQYDRDMAFQTLKLVMKLGYRIVKDGE